MAMALVHRVENVPNSPYVRNPYEATQSNRSVGSEGYGLDSFGLTVPQIAEW